MSADAEELRPGNLLLRFRWIAVDVGQFRGRDVKVLLWWTVDLEPEHKPNQGEKAGREKSIVPAKAQDDERYQKRGDCSADVGPGVEDASREGALFLGKSFCRGFDGGGKISCLSKPEQKTHETESDDGTGQCADVGNRTARSDQGHALEHARKEMYRRTQLVCDPSDRYKKVTDRSSAPQNYVDTGYACRNRRVLDSRLEDSNSRNHLALCLFSEGSIALLHCSFCCTIFVGEHRGCLG